MFLIVGGDSEIGAAAYAALKARGMPVVATTRRSGRIAVDRPYLDLSAVSSDWQPPPGTTAACLCAAVARLGSCAADPEGSSEVNVRGTLQIVEKLLSRGIYTLFLSTNQVFDGATPHVPADAPHSPKSEYGRQKARTEAVLLDCIRNGRPAAILRLAKVVSAGMSLLQEWKGALRSGRQIRAFTDMTLAPAPADLVCAAISTLLKDRTPGIFQLTGPVDVSYADVARFIAGEFGADPALVIETSANLAGLPEGATPRHTTLDSELLRTRYGLTVPDVWQVVGEIISAPNHGETGGGG